MTQPKIRRRCDVAAENMSTKIAQRKVDNERNGQFKSNVGPIQPYFASQTESLSQKTSVGLRLKF